MSQQVLHANKFNGFGFICIASEVSMQYQHTTQLSAVYNWQCDKGVSIIIYLFNVNEHVDWYLLLFKFTHNNNNKVD